VLPAVKEIIVFALPIAAPFVIGALIAALIDPLVAYFGEELKIKRGTAVFFSLSLIFVFVIFLAVIGISKLSVEMVKLSKELPNYSRNLTIYAKDLITQVRAIFSTLDPQWMESMHSTVGTIISGVTNVTYAATNLMFAIIKALPNLLLLTMISLIASFFLSRDKETIAEFFTKVLPVRTYEGLFSIAEDLGKTIFGYLRAQLTLMFITAAQTIVGLILLGVDYALTMGLLVGIFDILPILGPGTVFIPWIIVEIIKSNYSLAVGISILYIFIIAVRQILEPKVVADSIGLHPLATLMSIYIGLKIFGFIGMVLGPILLVMGKAVVRGGIFSKWL
ncbi:MAG: sporulation integral membrane protein YtvI, partial [Clostridia bacterium]|nr:sporulation integral membrane protein YtvI [Clostridia bacterium]